MAALLIKESVNQTVDNMGFYNALNACFSLHQLNHAHWAEVTNGESILAVPSTGSRTGGRPPPVKASGKTTVEEVAQRERLGIATDRSVG